MLRDPGAFAHWLESSLSNVGRPGGRDADHFSHSGPGKGSHMRGSASFLAVRCLAGSVLGPRQSVAIYEHARGSVRPDVTDSYTDETEIAA